MKEKVFTGLGPLALLFIIISCVQLCSIALAEANGPPATPSVPTGLTSVSSGIYYSYVTKATDPDGDQVKYTFDWGDGVIYTTCLVNQGTTVRVFHEWAVDAGSTKTFSVSAKATDKYGAASSWSSPLRVTTTGQATTNNPPATPSVPTGSTSGSSGTSYSYSTKATDPDGDDVKYSFDWGDGTTSVTSLVSSGLSASASHIWTVASGSTETFSVSAKTTDKSGTDSSWSSPLKVTITGPATTNNPPATPSVPTGSASGSSGTSYSYSTKATDPDGDNVKYTFDWGDGTTSATSLVSSGTSASASHKWTVASGLTKTFSVRTRAEDESGTDSSWSSSLLVTITGPVVVNNPPATPSVPSGPTSDNSGISYSYSTKATDPDGDNLKYTFNWGDGTTSATSLVSSGTSASASHIWTVASGSTKTFSVSAKATDENGAVSSWSSPLSVTITGPVVSSNNPPATPSIPSGQITGYSGTTYKYSTRANDPDGDNVKYTFDWGDGTTSVTSLVSSGTTASASHKWTVAPGTKKTFNLCVRATDERNKDSSWSIPSPIVIVAPKVNHPPTLPSIPSGPTSCVSGKFYTFSTSSTDPDGDLIKYIFDWGDGSSETGFFPSGQVVTASHSWNIPAGSTRTYNVRALSADSKYLTCLSPYWSNPLIVTITCSSSSTSYQELSLQTEGNETVYVQTEYAQNEESELIYAQTNETYLVDTQTEEDEFVDAQTNETEFVDVQTNETDSVDTQTDETDSVDTQTEEDEFVDAETNETDSVDTQNEEDEFVDAETNETDLANTQTEAANLTTLQRPSSIGVSLS